MNVSTCPLALLRLQHGYLSCPAIERKEKKKEERRKHPMGDYNVLHRESLLRSVPLMFGHWYVDSKTCWGVQCTKTMLNVTATFSARWAKGHSDANTEQKKMHVFLLYQIVNELSPIISYCQKVNSFFPKGFIILPYEQQGKIFT